MPHPGVYPLTPELHEILTEEFHSITSRDVLYEQVVSPIFKIVEDVRKGGHPYVAAERYRAWAELVEESLGIPMPDWKSELLPATKLAAGEEQEWLIEYEQMFFMDFEYDWEAYFSPTDAGVPDFDVLG